ncbi:arginine--tRNA ligase, partial [bacterium]|nr:arginine--tRNA ligase [bacterium]
MRQLLLEEVRRTVKTAFPDVPDEVIERLGLDPPRDPEHGDFATNAAFLLKDSVKDNPRRIAEALVAGMSGAESLTEAEVAGPGFINFRVRPAGIQRFLRQLGSPAVRAGMMRDAAFAAETGKMQIEFVSANPTGPMNVVSARAAAFGDACVRLLRATGVDVAAEFYVNAAGNQAELFGDSLRTRFLQAAGRSVELAEDAYRGDYV